MTVAALYVDPKGTYADLSGVDVWDEARDARRYEGPFPIVAHPPCTRWCQLAAFVEARHSHYKRGEDGGCFESALLAVRTWGGVLEHPAFSHAWATFGLNAPPSSGGWVNADWFGGWTCYVEQWRYGHRVRKATWLYAFGVASLPELRWGYLHEGKCANLGLVSWSRNRVPHDDRPRLGKKAASATPKAFRDVLLGMAKLARGASPEELAAYDRHARKEFSWLQGRRRKGIGERSSSQP